MQFLRWVKLMRRRNAKNAHSRVLNASDIIILEPKQYYGCWRKLFNNNNPIYLEIGMGKGKFIIENAEKNPHINYIGIEKYEGVIIQAADKLKNHPLPNLYLISVDATNLLEIFAENEINKIFLNFSDPWPKTRHAKRRLTSKKFLDMYQIILNGELEFKTDNQGLFEYSLMSLNASHWQFLDLTFNLHKRDENIITTEYEDKFSMLGHPIYYVRTKSN